MKRVGPITTSQTPTDVPSGPSRRSSSQSSQSGQITSSLCAPMSTKPPLERVEHDDAEAPPTAGQGEKAFASTTAAETAGLSAAVVLTLLPPSSGLGAHALAERLDAACAVEPANFGGHWWLPQCFPQAQVAFTKLTGKLGDAHPPPPPAWWESRSLWWWLCGLGRMD